MKKSTFVGLMALFASFSITLSVIDLHAQGVDYAELAELPVILEFADGEPRIIAQRLLRHGQDPTFGLGFPPGAIIGAVGKCPPGFMLHTDEVSGEPIYMVYGLLVLRDGSQHSPNYHLLLACERVSRR